MKLVVIFVTGITYNLGKTLFAPTERKKTVPFGKSVFGCFFWF